MRSFKGIAEEITGKMLMMRDDNQARHLMRFFKCAEGEYGDGDRFLGIRVPQTRTIVKEYRDKVGLSDATELVLSPWHEVRLAGFLLMVELYRKKRRNSTESGKEIVDWYLDNINNANNWDLVDLTAPYILGDWLVDHAGERKILYSLTKMEGKLWHQRVAMVANWMLIRHGEYDDVFRLAKLYLTHTHDLIHKASGWMLREVGKHGGGSQLRKFLDCNAAIMPRTMLRYAIEKFSEQERQYYMKLPR